ncbi:hypothetical protein KP509_08G004200 [Ceratopteris richardii]|uniref:Vacuolar protein sorting-associated protein 62 n=1 Tax=Ceratopteris richardii TaxID=49495 RepID=A0A8T2U9H7_CERRI|nr:hypothetical protein KP509_08G004200 [Ceratopteris richardii]
MGCVSIDCLEWLSSLYNRCFKLLRCSFSKSSSPFNRRWRCRTKVAAQPFSVSSRNSFGYGPGTEFASGSICFGDIFITQATEFQKVWSTSDGANNGGVAFYKPVNLPRGFQSLGYLSFQNDGSFEGLVLVAMNNGNSYIPALSSPKGFTLVWSYIEGGTFSGPVYFWQPIPPDGYASLGYVVTLTADAPSLGEIACVRVDLTDVCKLNAIAWETDTPSSFKVWNLIPTEIGADSLGVPVGAFGCGTDSSSNGICVGCLKNTSFMLSGMPSREQLTSLINEYGPTIYFHPDEKYFPCSVSWFFGKSILLFSRCQNIPITVSADGSNLPQGGSDDDEYWLDLPNDGTAHEVKRGSLANATVYVHAKPMFGAAFTDIAFWLFYAFNGSATAKLEVVNLSLGKIGEHVSDWEHVTLRINNLTGKLSKVFFSQHSGGVWVNPADLEYAEGSRFVVYSSKSGHASYPKPGLVLQGDHGIGIRNDTAKSQYVLDSSQKFEFISADYLGSENAPGEPVWLQYMRKWGPKIEYDLKQEIEKAIHKAPSVLRSKLRSLIKKLPDEVFGEEGPTGPKQKSSWMGDEKV